MRVASGVRLCWLTLCLVPVCGGWRWPWKPPDATAYCVHSPASHVQPSESCSSQVEMYANVLKSPVKAVPYHYNRFNFCESNATEVSLSFGQTLLGDRLVQLPHQLPFKKSVEVQELCTKTYNISDENSNKELQLLKDAMKYSYRHNWFVDNLPVLYNFKMSVVDQDGGNMRPMDNYLYGISVGCAKQFETDTYPCLPIGSYHSDNEQTLDVNIEEYVLFNHIDLEIFYKNIKSSENSSEPAIAEIIKVTAFPISVDYSNPRAKSWYGKLPLQPEFIQKIPLHDVSDLTVTYTYGVTYTEVESDSPRWYSILGYPHNNMVLYLSLLNSFIGCLVLAISIAKILYTIIYKKTSEDEMEGQRGWRALKPHVFTPPRFRMFFSIVFGNGLQLFFTCGVTAFFNSLGFFPAANRGTIITCALILWSCFGFLGGHTSARMYKVCGGEKWLWNAFLTAVIFPGIIFGAVMVLYLVYRMEDSSSVLPPSTLLNLGALWCAVYFPLTMVGAYFGTRKAAGDRPLRKNVDPRPIPTLRCYKKPAIWMTVAGLLPAAPLFVATYFILNSMWNGTGLYGTYEVNGILLFLTGVESFFSAAGITVLLCHQNLKHEDYQWWWRSFVTGALAGVYLMVYCTYFFVKMYSVYPDVPAVTIFFHFAYALIVVFCLSVMSGTVAFISCSWYISKIYRTVQTDSTEKLPDDNDDESDAAKDAFDDISSEETDLTNAETHDTVPLTNTASCTV